MTQEACKSGHLLHGAVAVPSETDGGARPTCMYTHTHQNATANGQQQTLHYKPHELPRALLNGTKPISLKHHCS